MGRPLQYIMIIPVPLIVASAQVSVYPVLELVGPISFTFALTALRSKETETIGNKIDH